MGQQHSVHTEQRDQRQIGLWLLICCALIFSMVVLGGVTRLTGSGLSMVEWDPIMGIVPPVTAAEWEDVFAKYRQSPEYLKINRGMDLAGFKRIFLYEYAHRVLGRLIGIVFLVPFLYFALRRKISRPLIPKLVGIFVLGGLQGLLGWYMVKSGLVHEPHVSQYRLAAHLMLAVLIYGYTLWVAFSLLFPHSMSSAERQFTALRWTTYAVVGLVIVTMTSGAFVAGLKAGFAYNTFPLMDGRWIPAGIFNLDPWPINLFENTATVQFDHRVLAILLIASIVILWLVALRYDLPTRLAWAVHVLLVTGLLQVALGISTLLLHVPIPLAAAHQAGSLVVLTVGLFIAHQLVRNGPVTQHQ